MEDARMYGYSVNGICMGGEYEKRGMACMGV